MEILWTFFSCNFEKPQQKLEMPAEKLGSLKAEMIIGMEISFLLVMLELEENKLKL